MALSITIKGKAKIFRLFDLERVLGENGIDIGEIDLAQQEDIRALYERAAEYLETGEVGAYDDLLFHLHGIDPEECTIELRDETCMETNVDEITLKNEPVTKLLQRLERYEDGHLFFTTLTTGDALWDFDTDLESAQIAPQKLTLGYYDCPEEIDQYEAIETELYDDLCDTLSTDLIRYSRATPELHNFVLHQQQLFGRLYVVRKTVGSRVKLLERIDLGGLEMNDQSWFAISDKFSDA